MFWHNFKYTFKILIKDKALIFWSLIWPIVLGTFFYLAFSNINDSEKLSIIDFGIVQNEAYNANDYLVSTFNNLGDKTSDNHILNITYDTKDKLQTLLDNGNIEGYLYIDNDTNLIVKENGINQTILKYVIEEIYSYQQLTNDIVEQQVATGNSAYVNQIYANIITKMNDNQIYLNEDKNSNMDYSVIEYYTLIAMTCLFGALITCQVIGNYLANINKRGARVSLAPLKRFSLVLSGLLVSFVVQLIIVGILLFYTKMILGIDFGNNFLLVILLAIIGSLAGNSIGLLIGSISFKNENLRIGFSIFVTMLGCFFAGMMGISMKYVIDKNIPIINKLNPASMITDGFYALYYYHTTSRYYFDIASLLTFSIIALIISYIVMRRKKYDSI